MIAVDHLRLVPDPAPADSVAYLEMILSNARITFGAGSGPVKDLEARLQHVRAMIGGEKPV